MLMNQTKFLTAVVALLLALAPGSPTFAADSTPPAAETKHVLKSVKPEQAQKLISDKKVIVLDVRTPEEFASGHIAGSTNIDFKAADFSDRIAKLDKSQAYLVHCASGIRSAKACAAMEQLDFLTVYDLKGGIAAWKDAGLPVEK